MTGSDRAPSRVPVFRKTPSLIRGFELGNNGSTLTLANVTNEDQSPQSSENKLANAFVS